MSFRQSLESRNLPLTQCLFRPIRVSRVLTIALEEFAIRTQLALSFKGSKGTDYDVDLVHHTESDSIMKSFYVQWQLQAKCP